MESTAVGSQIHDGWRGGSPSQIRPFFPSLSLYKGVLPPLPYTRPIMGLREGNAHLRPKPKKGPKRKGHSHEFRAQLGPRRRPNEP